jgi:hypothetical protein
VVNLSLSDIVISNSLRKAVIRFGADFEKFYYQPRIESDHPITCGTRAGNFFVVRQAVRAEEVTRFRERDSLMISFDELEVTFQGNELQDTLLDTHHHYLDTKKGGWRALERLENVCLFTYEQWKAVVAGDFDGGLVGPAKIETDPNSRLAEPPSHNIVAQKPIQEYVYLDANRDVRSVENLRYEELSQMGKEELLKAIIIRLHNKPDSKRIVGDLDGISLNLIFWSDTTVIDIPRSAWMDNTKEHMAFHLNNAPYAVVLLIGAKEVFALDKDGTKRYRGILQEERYHLTVQLVGEKIQKPIAEFSYDLRLGSNEHGRTANITECLSGSAVLCIQDWKKE